MVTGDHLRMSYVPLNGKTLGGLYKHFVYHKDKPESKSSMAFLRMELGLPPRPSGRTYRLNRLSREIDRSEVIAEADAFHLDLLLLIRRIGWIYYEPQFGLTREEIEQEATKVVMDYAKSEYGNHKWALTQLVWGHFEQYHRDFRTRFYKERSLEQLMEGRSDVFSISDELVTWFEDEHSEAILEIPALSPLQRTIAKSILFSHDLVTEVASKLKMTDEEIDEHFGDIVTIMQDWYTQQSGEE